MTYISFALVGEKTPYHDRKDYLIRKFSKLKKEKILNFERIIKDNGHENDCKEYCFECDYEQCKCEIHFLYEEYGNIQHLYVKIRAEESSNEQQEEWIEQVKFSLKGILRRDWERLFWFRDTASAKLSKELYPVVYDVENLLRQLIYEVIIKMFGLQWWENHITSNIEAKYKKRYVNFKKIAPSFNDIDDKLLSIDVDDLKKILYFEIYRWEPAYDVEIERMICDQSKPRSLDSIMDKLKKQRKLVCNLWDEYFSRCIQSDSNFEKLLNNYIMHRNHIAHNKLLDRRAFERIQHGCKKISKILNEAIDEIPHIILSKDETEQQEILKEIWEETVREGYKQLIESECGVRVLREEEILKRYDEVLEIIYDRIEMELDYRNDLEYSTYKSILNLDLIETPVFTVSHKVTGDIVVVYCSLDIDDSPSGISNAKLLFRKNEDDGGYEIELHYINGEAQFDDESGTYMPVTADEMQWPDEIVDEGASYIDDVLKNLRREVDGNRYYREKNGEMSPCAELPCEECGQGYICIDEKFAPIGTCLNCGAKNEIVKCDRCGEYFKGTDDDFLCENCQEKIDRE